MREPEEHGPKPASVPAGETAAVVLDAEGVVIARSESAATLLECSPGQLCAPLLELLSRAGTEPEPAGRRTTSPTGTTRTAATTRTTRTTITGGEHAGQSIPLDCTLVRLTAHTRGDRDAGARWLVLVEPTRTPAAAAAAAQAPAAAASDAERRRTALSHAAAASIGASLDVTDMAQILVNLLVPDFADLATVDLAEPVLVGDEPPHHDSSGEVRLRRTATAQSPGIFAEDLLPVGEALPPVPDAEVMRPLMEGRPVLVPDVAVLRATLGVDPETLRLFVPSGAHSSVAVPLYARGLILGCVTVWRSQLPAAFDEEDAAVLHDVASRAALGVDNARRYTKEHRSVVALQRSLLPHSVLNTAAADTAGIYQPAGGAAGVGGDWFDVIPLPSLRVAFVVGDVVGHGLEATAAMARLRTAVQTLADLDLDPGELLTHLDDLVLGFSSEQMAGESRAEPAVLGATCLYAVYDPVTRRCAAATAGHLPPALLPPGEEPFFLEMAPGPPLGVGGMPFEVTEFEVRPGSLLAFFTDGLVERRGGDIGEGLEKLRSSLAGAGPGLPLGEISQVICDKVLDPEPTDDVALLLARTRALSSDQVAEWQIEADLSRVAHARELVVGQLSDWQLDELGFVTELVASELVTNAIRYAGGPVGLRLIRDRVLVCEVSDPSGTQPRLRRARETDEGGRGLFLVAQLTDRWGSRFTPDGKTIWTEQAMDGTP
ncbi:ATP-binding SpoIIE family protein phosphatase [Streptomyces sp. 4.24]|uniref:ATP-binding SpoIIE family protein phosphatase n=1 Tax=Streptomyces tritrimontium TaxID=3406573 RepID=UPI003BB5C0C0